IVGELLEHGPGARRPFILDEAHRPAADMLADLLERIGRGDSRRHDETARRDDLAERQQHFRIGLFQHQRKVPSSTTASSFSIALIIWPMGSRAAHRLMLATASLARTGSPSWNLSPGRSRNVQTRPSADTSSASTIWRCTLRLASMPYSMS